MANSRTTINVDTKTSSNLAILAERTNTSKTDFIRQTCNTFLSNTMALKVIKQQLGSVNIANVIEAGVEAELVKAKRRAITTAYNDSQQQAAIKNSTQISLFNALKRYVSEGVTLQELALAIVTEHAYLTEQLDDFVSKRGQLFNQPYEQQASLIERASNGAFSVNRVGVVVSR